MKKYWSWVMLAFLLGGVAFWASESRMAQLANLRVPQSTFPEVYLQMDVGSDTKCLVSGRAGTTEKRSDLGLAKASWRCRVETPSGQPSVFVADSKRRPSHLFAPFTAVSDLVYPLVYEEVRAGEALTLPDMHWVHLYYNRQFQGLYLEISLPGRHFAAERLEASLAGADGEIAEAPEGGDETPEPERLELLAVKGSELVCFDRKMRPVCPVYNLAVADGVFPRPQTTDGIALLQKLSALPAFSYILSDQRYDVLEPFPLPVDLGGLLAREPYIDKRYHRWQEPGTSSPAFQERYARLFKARRTATETHLRQLAASIQASCMVMECDATPHIERLRAGPAGRWLLDS